MTATASSGGCRRRSGLIRRTPIRPARRTAVGAAITAGLLLAAGCTSDTPPPPPVHRDPVVAAGAMRLVAFDSCRDALDRLRRAAKEHVGPYGFGGGYAIEEFAGGQRAVAGAPGVPAPAPAGDATNGGAKGGGQPNYSGTNTHEAGVDEPDLVKTDGRRIVTVNRGVLRVVDPATRKVTGTLDIGTDKQDPVRWGGADLLLHGDRALVLVRETYWGGPAIDRRPVPPVDGIRKITGPRLILVDLSGTPRVLSRYKTDGDLVDARQVGATARVVVRSSPRISFPYPEKGTDTQRTATNKRIIDKAGINAWLPRYEMTTNGRTTAGQVGCDRMSRPATYSGTAMVSILSFDLGGAALGDGDPVTVVADGQTVYSNGPSLYVANDQRWRVIPESKAGTARPEETTELYKFDTSKPGRPVYVAAGSVKGWLINQYAMSEWSGNLRVATTVGQAWGPRAKSSSTVYVLEQKGDALAVKGSVSGLGKGEQIYSVRFAGSIAYVVTFRQTDPLYTLDLSEPTRPRVTGELKITGYSAYLHPIDDQRLIGVGQEASTEGRVQGTQVSLFDVSDLERPARLAQHHVRAGHSEAEFDPHAFLYWPQDRLLVLPLTVYNVEPGLDAPAGKPATMPMTGAMVLRVGDTGFTELAMINHTGQHGGGMIRRSLVVDGVLWTVSDSGLKATSVSTLDTLAWISTT
ncbi:MAG TPA: beta-propeller domain-containing protein [Pilimelia sp.]|nr:beta-propeller domain-containing protein [Pilimelia sp.]